MGVARQEIGHTSQTRSAAGAGRYLILVRAGDNSLHSTWLDPAGGARNWDLHVSHYGRQADPPADLAPGIMWSNRERKPKWPGLADAVASGLWSLDDYDWIAIADDDLIVEAGAWSSAFETARTHNLPACQLSLLHDSFFGEIETLRVPGLLFHHVARVEQMALIVRVDLFRRLIPFMGKARNLWAMDHVLVHLADEEARRFAVLDNASALHTRRFWIGPAYKDYANGGASALAEEAAFLSEHNIAWVPQEFRGGVGLDGKPIANPWWWKLAIVPARVLRKFRQIARTAQIASRQDNDIWLLRRFAGVRVGRVDARRASARS